MSWKNPMNKKEKREIEKILRPGEKKSTMAVLEFNGEHLLGPAPWPVCQAKKNTLSTLGEYKNVKHLLIIKKV